MAPSDRLDLMTFFVRLSETGTLTEAGRSIGLSQPSASRLLKKLEAMLECRLVRRSTRELTLTEAGRRFLASSRTMLESWQAAVDDLQVERRQVSGNLRIAAPIAIGQDLLASIASPFLLEHPGVTIDWELRDDLLDPDAEGYDLWIRAGSVGRDALVVRELWHAQRGILGVARARPIDRPDELGGARAVRLSTFCPVDLDLTDDGGDTCFLSQRCAFTTDNLFAALAAVRQGVGFAVLPLWAVQGDLASGDLVRLCPRWRAPMRARRRAVDRLCRGTVQIPAPQCLSRPSQEGAHRRRRVRLRFSRKEGRTSVRQDPARAMSREDRAADLRHHGRRPRRERLSDPAAKRRA